MAQRLLAFAFALVFAAAPVAGEICEITCAEHGGHSGIATADASHHQHAAEGPGHVSHHHASLPSTPASTHVPSMMAVPHGCGQLDAVVSESRDLVRVHLVRGILTTTVSMPTVSISPAAAASSRYGPPGPNRSLSHLRV